MHRQQDALVLPDGYGNPPILIERVLLVLCDVVRIVYAWVSSVLAIILTYQVPPPSHTKLLSEQHHTAIATHLSSR